MVSVQDRLKLKRESCDTWSTREQLCLASSVLKSGDQNWISVSRSLKPFAEKEALRPSDWFSQKSCAIQYAILIENADTPKRKKRESGETTGESIVRRLTQERIAELGQILAFQRDEYQQLKSDVNLLKSGSISDEKLQKMWQSIEQEERDAEQKARAHSAWLAKRQQKQEPTSRDSGNSSTPKKSLEVALEPSESLEGGQEVDEERKNRGGRSPLLTSLLKSPSPTTQIQNTPSTVHTQSPTIASLLGATTKPQTSQVPQNLTPQLQQLVSTSISSPITSISSISSMSSVLKEERPSAGAPTLSMMLQLPTNIPRVSLSTLPNQNTSSTTSSSTLGPLKSQKSHVNDQISVPAATPAAQSVNESMIQMYVLGKDKLPEGIDKDEINEIIGDIEELIKEEISPVTKVTSSEVDETVTRVLDDEKKSQKRIRCVDESISPSNSSHSELGIEEIEQSTSRIAEIIGTAIDTKPKVIVQQISQEKQFDNKKVDRNGKKKEKFIENKIEGKSVRKEEKQKKEVEEKVKVKEFSEDNTKSNNFGKEEKNESTVNESKMEKENTEGPEENAITPIEIPIGNSESVDEKLQVVEQKKYESEKEDSIDDISEKNSILKSSEEDTTAEKCPTGDESEIKEKESLNCSISISNKDTEGEQTQEENAKIESCIKETVDEANVEEQEEKQEDQKAGEEEEEEEGEEEKEGEEEEEKNVPFNTPELDVKIIEDVEKSRLESEETEQKIDVNEDLQDLAETSISQPPEEQSEISSLHLHSNDDFTIENEKTVLETMESKHETGKPEIKSEIDENVEGEKEALEDRVKYEEKKEMKDEVKVKKEEASTSAADDTEEEESSITKLSGRAMKTYSKKQNVAIDSEPETESSEGADYRAWKKSIMLVFNRLATHKYASLFLKPITEENAPGYHSVVFRPMDLSTIKKNIDNGTIRSTMQFQRDVMLMFQNAIMYNKHDTTVYKMAVSMQEECLEQLQVLVEVTVEGPFRRETRTAASSSSETSESSNMKRKRSHITPSPLDTDSPRMKKRRKSEND